MDDNWFAHMAATCCNLSMKPFFIPCYRKRVENQPLDAVSIGVALFEPDVALLADVAPS